MFRRYLADLIVVGGGILVGLLISLYMTAIRAPAVVEVRPQLVEVDFWTAIFSGRGSAWMWYHYPTGATIFLVAFLAILGFISLRL